MTYHPRTVAHSNSGIKLLSMVMFALNPLSVFRYFQGYLLEETKNEKATEYHARTSSSSTNPAATGAGVKKTESTESKIEDKFNDGVAGIEMTNNPMKSARNIVNSGEASESKSSLPSDSRPRANRASSARRGSYFSEKQTGLDVSIRSVADEYVSQRRREGRPFNPLFMGASTQAVFSAFLSTWLNGVPSRNTTGDGDSAKSSNRRLLVVATPDDTSSSSSTQPELTGVHSASQAVESLLYQSLVAALLDYSARLPIEGMVNSLAGMSPDTEVAISALVLSSVFDPSNASSTGSVSTSETPSSSSSSTASSSSSSSSLSSLQWNFTRRHIRQLTSTGMRSMHVIFERLFNRRHLCYAGNTNLAATSCGVDVLMNGAIEEAKKLVSVIAGLRLSLATPLYHRSARGATMALFSAIDGGTLGEADASANAAVHASKGESKHSDGSGRSSSSSGSSGSGATSDAHGIHPQVTVFVDRLRKPLGDTMIDISALVNAAGTAAGGGVSTAGKGGKGGNDTMGEGNGGSKGSSSSSSPSSSASTEGPLVWALARLIKGDATIFHQSVSSASHTGPGKGSNGRSNVGSNGGSRGVLAAAFDIDTSAKAKLLSVMVHMCHGVQFKTKDDVLPLGLPLRVGTTHLYVV